MPHSRRPSLTGTLVGSVENRRLFQRRMVHSATSTNTRTGPRPAISLLDSLSRTGWRMSGERLQRRLAAILAADIAGYSRLMGADEEGTLTRLKALRSGLIDPKIAEHRGRIFKTTGDGILIEFASVVDALRCALEVQAGMGEQNAVPSNQRIEFRIGIHQGDILVDGDDILGDGVNIAARLEALAEPGGICVSGRGQEDAAGKLDLARPRTRGSLYSRRQHQTWW